MEKHHTQRPTKNNHVVPQVYLKNFSLCSFSANPLVWQIGKDGDAKRLTVNQVCVRKKFYSQLTESHMSKNEEREIATTLKLIALDFWMPQFPYLQQFAQNSPKRPLFSHSRISFDRTILSRFVENLAVRSPAYRERLQNDVDNPASMLYTLKNLSPVFNGMFRGTGQGVQEKILRGEPFKSELGRIIYFSDFTFSINFNADYAPFVTSDNPVIIRNLPEASFFTLISNSTPPFFYLPLHPRLALRIDGFSKQAMETNVQGKTRSELLYATDYEPILQLNADIYNQSQFLISNMYDAEYIGEIIDHANRRKKNSV